MISTKELKYYIRKLELSLIEREKKYLENESDLYLGATEEQKTAIYSIFGDYLVVAGAGSGKTKTLIFRVKEMERQGIKIENILVMTFSKKAALELKLRARTSGIDIEKTSISTFHSFCFKLLKDNYVYFKLLSKRDKKIIDNYFNRENISDKKDDYLLENGYLDYAEITKKVADTLKSNKEFLKKTAEKYRHIMIDEYQDMDYFQKEIVMALNMEGSNVMAFGDDCQSIYAFRGADYKNILLFKKDFPKAKLIKFQTNFRSSEEIVGFIDSLTDKIEEKFNKNVISFAGKFEKPKVIKFKNLEDEGEYIALSLKKIVSNENFKGSIGVLYRNKYLVEHIEKKLKKYDIKYSKKKEEDKIYKHIESFLDLYRIFKRPDFFKVEKVRLTINESETEKKFKTSLLIEYFEKVDEIIREYGESCDKNLELLIESMESGIYRQMVEVYIKFKILEDEEKLLSELLILYKKLNSEKINLEEIENTVLINGKTSCLEELKFKEFDLKSYFSCENNEKNGTVVELLTVHASKGLEWDYLYVATAVDGVYPSIDCKDENHNDIMKRLDEERRVFYVACSRAIKNLTITYPKQVHWFSKDCEGMTPFVKELSNEKYEFYDKEI
ncbi:MAG: ATP-dependent helicase [Fusobacteriaceae bacterium]|nr:ATP-dependent helicase [Fusobacteriaceae bacterium]